MKAMMKVLIALALMLSAAPAFADELCQQADWDFINSALKSERVQWQEPKPGAVDELRAAMAKRGKRSCRKIAENAYRNGELQGKAYIIAIDSKVYSAFFAVQDNEAVIVNLHVSSQLEKNF